MGRLKEAHEKVLSGVEAFKLNDTFGFPLDLTREIAAEAGFAVDEAAFHIEMTKQRERARAERLAKDISGWSADLFGELTAEPTSLTATRPCPRRLRFWLCPTGRNSSMPSPPTRRARPRTACWSCWTVPRSMQRWAARSLTTVILSAATPS